MTALDVQDAPRDVTPRKTRSDAGKPRAKLTPGDLRARADELEREAADKAVAKCAAFVIKARKLLDQAVETGAPKAEELRQWIDLMPMVLP
jgi:hypothetical protein